MENSNQKFFRDPLDEDVLIEVVDPAEIKRRKKEERKAVLMDNKGKILSLIIALLYLILGAAAGGVPGFFQTLYFLILPMALIWFSDALGGHTGSSLGFGGSTMRRITAPTPAVFVKIAGWFILFFPFIQIIFIAIFLTP